MRQFMLLLAAAALVLIPAAAHADLGDQLYKLLPNDGSEDDHFGLSVAISGTTAIIGAGLDDDNGYHSGSAYLFNTTTGQQIMKLLPEDGAVGDRFGTSVAFAGATAIVGAYYDDDNGDYSGSAYLFDATTGQQIAKLLPDDGAEEDYFGVSVAISGATAVVGSYGDDDNGIDSGCAYLFDSATGEQIAKLLPNDGAAEDYFGLSVAIDGETAIVGAVWDDVHGLHSGAAYVFDISDAANPVQVHKLLPDDGATEDWFGFSVALCGTTAIVGALWDDDNGLDSGSAYLFDTTTGLQIAKLLPDDGAAGDAFGVSIRIDADNTIVGAMGDGDNGNASGSAYLFDTTTGVQTAKLLPDDGATYDYFGQAVAIGGTTAIVTAPKNDDMGANSGAAYLFDAAGGSDCLVDSDGDGMVTICHVPPGNPDNAHTITVGVNAVPAHLAHGDHCGPCEEDDALLMQSGGDTGHDPCLADLDDSGDVGPADLAELLVAWGTHPGHPADLDGDGEVGPLDLALVLGNWGPCP